METDRQTATLELWNKTSRKDSWAPFRRERRRLPLHPWAVLRTDIRDCLPPPLQNSNLALHLERYFSELEVQGHQAQITSSHRWGSWQTSTVHVSGRARISVFTASSPSIKEQLNMWVKICAQICSRLCYFSAQNTENRQHMKEQGQG